MDIAQSRYSFTQFASGASGFPVRIENFEIEKKIDIVNSNPLSLLNNYVAKLVSATLPNYVIPYAGYFTEIARDNDVKAINTKNSQDDLIYFVEKNFKHVKGLNPIDNPHFILGDQLECVGIIESPEFFIDHEYINSIIYGEPKKVAELTPAELTMLCERFISSDFINNLTVVLIPMNESIDNDTGLALILDFSTNNRNSKIININGISDEKLVTSLDLGGNNLEILHIRAESLALVVRSDLPLEDLSIGFQTKMYRKPNVYNFKFWDHFTNKEFIRI